MEINFFIKGIILGFSVAAPVGPIGILCIRRTLTHGRASGFVSGLGAATADTLYGSVAAFGLTIISTFLLSVIVPLRVIGGAFLLYLGIKIFLSKPSNKILDTKEHKLIGDYLSTVFLTITNPTTILSFIAMFAALGLGSNKGNYTSSILMVIGVFCGSALWWFILSSGVYILHSKFTSTAMMFVNRISGIVIILFALYAWLSLLN